mmetsp:Transcript_46437/g.85048  ORF Transcript_46437/g.85048 Transcript_46437/m.85048 type:complete len:297 (+) Transcript_46437:79-969(+)
MAATRRLPSCRVRTLVSASLIFLSVLQLALFASRHAVACIPQLASGSALAHAPRSSDVSGISYELESAYDEFDVFQDDDLNSIDVSDDDLSGTFDSLDGTLDFLEIKKVGKAVGAEQVVDVIKSWLQFLKGEAGRSSEQLADACGYPLEQALELAIEEFTRGAQTVITLDMPEHFPRDLGPIGLVATLRVGEDLDLSLFGGDEWETIHLDFLATNPLLGWTSHVNGEHLLEASGGSLLLSELLALAGKAGRAVTVSPLNEDLKDVYRELGFREDSLLDPTLMFWLPSEEERFYAYS